MLGPIFGLLFHWIGGFASASFYVPFKKVRLWSWEVFWIVGGVVSWIFAPIFFGSLMTDNLWGVLAGAPTNTLILCYLFGVAWGFGGLTFGLAVRYLGFSLGMAIALGLTTAFGTLIPPLWDGTLLPLVKTRSGQMVLLGVLITLIGIVVIAAAGRQKEQFQSDDALEQSVAEFSLKKGILVAVFSGVMSAFFAYGLAAGEPIRELTLAEGTSDLNQGLPVLVVILFGGFTTNALWCGYQIISNGTAKQFTGQDVDKTHSSQGGLMALQLQASKIPARTLLLNYLWCALAGLSWYLQFFFYTMGESLMGEQFAFASWTLHMASIIIFSTGWGIAFGEWNGVPGKTKGLVGGGIGLLVLATVIIGFGNSI